MKEIDIFYSYYKEQIFLLIISTKQRLNSPKIFNFLLRFLQLSICLRVKLNNQKRKITKNY